ALSAVIVMVLVPPTAALRRMSGRSAACVEPAALGCEGRQQASDRETTRRLAPPLYWGQLFLSICMRCLSAAQTSMSPGMRAPSAQARLPGGQLVSHQGAEGGWAESALRA